MKPKSKSKSDAVQLMFYKLLSRIPNYVRAFGLIHGIRLLLAIEFRTPKNQKVRRFSVPGYRGGIVLRDHIGDYSTFWQCIVQQQYDLKKFPNHNVQIDNQPSSESNTSRSKFVVIDGGANIGLSAIWYCEKYPYAKIICVEPDADNYNLLVQNTSGYADQVVCIRGALWNRHENIAIADPSIGYASVEIRQSENASDIKAIKMSDLIRDNAIKQIDILKLDIEGSQKQLFDGNPDWISICRLIILELEDWKYPTEANSCSFLSAIAARRFDVLIDGENIFAFNNTH